MAIRALFTDDDGDGQTPKPSRPAPVNSVLVCLSILLKTAVAWDRIREMPCTINLVKVDSQRGKAALAAHRHLRGQRIFYRPDGTTVSRSGSEAC